VRAEPWAGYARQSKQAREAMLRRKIELARERGDYAYCVALASAVVGYEPRLTRLRRRAGELHRRALSWQRS